jgi:hypothetical protein
MSKTRMSWSTGRDWSLLRRLLSSFKMASHFVTFTITNPKRTATINLQPRGMQYSAL